jgi:hypothetical protein
MTRELLKLTNLKGNRHKKRFVKNSNVLQDQYVFLPVKMLGLKNKAR